MSEVPEVPVVPEVRLMPSPAPYELAERVDAALTRFLSARRAELESLDDALRAPLDAAATLLAGGKRLRPAFCYWAWRGAGGDPDGPDGAPIVEAAAALEFLQASAIVHDDVMDASDVRRGQPAVHRRLADLHRAAGWQGSATMFGNGGAILLGDLLLCWLDEAYRRSGLAAQRLLAAYPVLDLMRAEVMAGQYLDLVGQATRPIGVEQAMRIVRYKSAKYTVERPLHLGAALATGRRDEALEAALSAYGLPLGEAFQLRDDVLGVFGDPRVTGKPAGDDLREGKSTVLVARTLAAADPAQAANFLAGLGDPDLDEDRVGELRTIIVETGALERVETSIRELTARAGAGLAEARLEPEARVALEDLADAATRRTT